MLPNLKTIFEKKFSIIIIVSFTKNEQLLYYLVSRNVNKRISIQKYL
jgi:hypothetical protein